MPKKVFTKLLPTYLEKIHCELSGKNLRLVLGNFVMKWAQLRISLGEEY